MTFDDFIKKYNNKFVEYHSYSIGAKNQCVDLANQYIVEVLGLPAIIGTNAQQFPDKAGDKYEYILNTPTGIPQKGDLIIWSSTDNVGHIAIFIDGDANKFNSFDQNYPTGTPCHIQAHTYLRPKVIGWLRAKVQSNQEFMQIEKKVFESLVTKSTAYDKFVEAGYHDAQSVTLSIETYTDRINTLKNGFDDFLREMVTILDPDTVIEIADQDLVKNLAKKVVSDFSSVQSELLKKEKQWQQQEKSLEDENLELEKQVGSLKQEVERLLKRIERVETDLQTYKDKKAENDKFYGFIETIKRLFERK